MQYEGGFQGRTNKLVDGCYSFWCGAIFPIVQALIAKKGSLFDFYSKTKKSKLINSILIISEVHFTNILKKPTFNSTALQEYVLICCQRPQGGLLDKPDK